MKRRRAREYAMQVLYQADLTGKPPRMGEFWEGREEPEDVRRFTEDIVRGTLLHIEEIDGVVSRAASHWQVGRMAAVDRNLMRAAVYELLYRDDIPPAVTINEALEIAKKFSTLESASFINGVLDKIAKTPPGGGAAPLEAPGG